MTFMTLLRAVVDKQIVYFDGAGMLYEKYPTRSHYMPTGRFIYYEYYERPLYMLEPCIGLVGAEEYEVTIWDAEEPKALNETKLLQQGGKENAKI